MIEELTIRNLGVISEATLPFGPGLTVLTGETGAGKTMVVTALGLLLGERSDSGALRRGGGAAVVEGHWVVDSVGSVAERVADAGGQLDSAGEGKAALVLGRSVSQEGRSRATVGGRSTPVGVLSELGEELVVVHGQSDQVRLRSATAQREALDRFAGPELGAALTAYQSAFTAWEAAQSELDVLVAESDRREREAAELRDAIDEIEQLAPQRGEDLELAERAGRLGNLEELRLAAATALEALSSQSLDGGADALGQLENARRHLERVASHDPALPPIVDAISETLYAATDVSSRLSSYLGGLDSDGASELESIEERRAALSALVRKHGSSLDEVIDLLDVGSARLLELDNDSTRIERLRAEVDAGLSKTTELGDELSRIRSAAAQSLSIQVTSELEALAMPDAEVTVTVQATPDYGLHGRDQVSFQLRPHPGAEFRPVGRGASGGELSRIMLAIEVVIAASDPVPTFIFDEVDAGVGGASAIEIGKRLARLATAAQVIVVTHLPQVAAFASNHLRVLKSSDGEFTASSVHQLGDEERAQELARMLSGLADSESGLAHARELLAAAQEHAR